METMTAGEAITEARKVAEDTRRNELVKVFMVADVVLNCKCAFALEYLFVELAKLAAMKMRRAKAAVLIHRATTPGASSKPNCSMAS